MNKSYPYDIVLRILSYTYLQDIRHFYTSKDDIIQLYTKMWPNIDDSVSEDKLWLINHCLSFFVEPLFRRQFYTAEFFSRPLNTQLNRIWGNLSVLERMCFTQSQVYDDYEEEP